MPAPACLFNNKMKQNARILLSTLLVAVMAGAAAWRFTAGTSPEQTSLSTLESAGSEKPAQIHQPQLVEARPDSATPDTVASTPPLSGETAAPSPMAATGASSSESAMPDSLDTDIPSELPASEAANRQPNPAPKLSQLKPKQDGPKLMKVRVDTPTGTVELIKWADNDNRTYADTMTEAEAVTEEIPAEEGFEETTQTLTIPQDEDGQPAPLPAIVASPPLEEGLTMEEIKLLNKLYDDFVEDVGDPTDPAHLDNWNTAVSASDARFRQLFGGRAFVQMQLRAYQEANDAAAAGN